MMIIIHKINYHVLKWSKCVKKRTIFYVINEIRKALRLPFWNCLQIVDIMKIVVTSFILKFVLGIGVGMCCAVLCCALPLEHMPKLKKYKLDRVHFIIRIVSSCIRFNPLLLLLSRYSHFPVLLYFHLTYANKIHFQRNQKSRVYDSISEILFKNFKIHFIYMRIDCMYWNVLKILACLWHIFPLLYKN